ncbi:MAG TPA: GTPase Era [Bacteroidota bacterium]|nr:GTPase Era [Bacteroidota bacterium]
MTDAPGPSEQAGFRSGYVAIVGRPNAGKSTLLNALLGQKLSIVSGKPQTTRHKILGILNEPGVQAVFMDTPGLIRPKYLLQTMMMKSVRSSLQDADLTLFLRDVTERPAADERKAEAEILGGIPTAVIVVLNKTDLSNDGEVNAVAAQFEGSSRPTGAILRVSALTGSGLDRLKAEIVRRLPLHPPYFPADSLSDQNERFFVAEIIREKVFDCYREEIPYSTTVRILAFEEKKGRKDLIEAEICVERESQKGILIGVKGAALKKTGQLARKDIEQFLGRGVFLELRVKVRPKWRDDRVWLKRLGYSD